MTKYWLQIDRRRDQLGVAWGEHGAPDAIFHGLSVEWEPWWDRYASALEHFGHHGQAGDATDIFTRDIVSELDLCTTQLASMIRDSTPAKVWNSAFVFRSLPDYDALDTTTLAYILEPHRLDDGTLPHSINPRDCRLLHQLDADQFPRPRHDELIFIMGQGFPRVEEQFAVQATVSPAELVETDQQNARIVRHFRQYREYIGPRRWYQDLGELTLDAFLTGRARQAPYVQILGHVLDERRKLYLNRSADAWLWISQPSRVVRAINLLVCDRAHELEQAFLAVTPAVTAISWKITPMHFSLLAEQIAESNLYDGTRTFSHAWLAASVLARQRTRVADDDPT